MKSRQIRVLVLAIVLASASSVAVLPGGGGAVAPPHPVKSAIVWMGLEITGENISADIRSIGIHRNDLTGVSYEHYLLGSQGYFGPILTISNVTGEIKSFGLQTYPMIISTNLMDIEYLIYHPSNFISRAVTKAEGAGYTGYNIDFEPSQAANATVAAAYASFLTAFANALHMDGRKLTVDIATWNPFWNFVALANTTVDTLYDMSTYASPSFNFAAALGYANQTIPHSKLGIGLITVNVNNGAVLQNYSVSARFQALEADGVTKIAVWDMPLAPYWWPYLHQFLGRAGVSANNSLLIEYAAGGTAALAIVTATAILIIRKGKKD
jgi:hypothetical protein